jgi:ribosomal protein L32
LQTAAEELKAILDGMLLAVPKRRTTWRKARLRMQNKWLKPVTHIAKCPVCDQSKLSHHLCLHCLRKNRPQLMEAREAMLAAQAAKQ